MFREIFEADDLLEPVFCDKFKEELIYLFYGRPCYRPHADVKPTSLSAFFLICILFEPTSLETPHRVMPLDSGAMFKGHYGSHLHPSMGPEHFELEPTINSAILAVDRFYGTNAAYFQGNPRRDIKVGPRDLEVESFLSIIRSISQESADDRRATIEIQMKQAINLKKSNVLAAILPEQLLADQDLEDFIEDDLGAEAIPYYCPHARPAEDARAIMIEAKRFYEKSGWL